MISTPRSPDPVRERGAGTFGMAAGLLVFLLLMFAAVQVLFNLYATTMVTTAPHDAARTVAGFRSSEDRCVAAREAEAAFIQQLGDYGRAGHADLEWTCTDPTVVRVRVRAHHPSLLPHRLGGLLSLTEVDRTIQVRIEDEQ